MNHRRGGRFNHRLFKIYEIEPYLCAFCKTLVIIIEVKRYSFFYSMGRYGSEIFRACRLVVDTGLHHFKWVHVFNDLLCIVIIVWKIMHLVYRWKWMYFNNQLNHSVTFGLTEPQLCQDLLALHPYLTKEFTYFLVTISHVVWVFSELVFFLLA